MAAATTRLSHLSGKISSHARFFTSYTATKSRQLVSANKKQAYSPRAVSEFKITSPPAARTAVGGRSLPSWLPSLSARNAVTLANDGEMDMMDNASNEQFKVCRKVRLRPCCQSYLRMNKDGSMEVAKVQGPEVHDCKNVFCIVLHISMIRCIFIFILSNFLGVNERISSSITYSFQAPECGIH